MSFKPEPSLPQGAAPRVAVLLVNLGTPDAPTPAAVRRYLAEFLGDPRVVEIPKFIWWFILHGIILRVRPAKSAAKYATIWTSEGSPLRTWTEKQTKLLLGYLGERGHNVVVRHAMRYGNPSIESALDALKSQGVNKILVVPLYPQYAASTTSTVWDMVARWALRTRVLPEFRFINQFHDDPGYINALVQRVRGYWMREGQPEKLLMSFHGLPARSIGLGDPYYRQCAATARRLAERLGLRDGQWVFTFQSRFGRARWLEPYTEPTLQKLAKEGAERIDVVCPGFVSDCLETLEEIAQEGRAAFLSSGGKEFHYIPCLNDTHEWMAALADLTLRHLQGWDTQRTATPAP